MEDYVKLKYFQLKRFESTHHKENGTKPLNKSEVQLKTPNSLIFAPNSKLK
ncbi:hypothetical protein Syun_021012 [Stephania yunnanensis]|uniref:Uncharacterized protein n=1 Tax=Stephania yunnanensis TaxID=152371 RepID=A0AAP0IFA9_9MAGN